MLVISLYFLESAANHLAVAARCRVVGANVTPSYTHDSSSETDVNSEPEHIPTHAFTHTNVHMYMI